MKRIERKRKLPTQGPVETAIIRVQQNFEIARDYSDRNRRWIYYKNAVCNLTPLGILFPASTKNKTEQVFITCRELNDI